MKWIKKISKEEYNFLSTVYVTLNDNNFKIKKVLPYGNRDKMSLLAQFFLLPLVINDNNMVLQIPAHKINLYNKVMEEVGIHFEKVRFFCANDETSNLILQDLNQSSKEHVKALYHSQLLHPILNDLYGRGEEKENIVLNVSDLIYMRVNLEKIKEVEMESFDEVWDFVYESFYPYKSICLEPCNWQFTDRLMDSISIKYFSKKVKDIILMVDSNSLKVMYIQLNFN
ncbi:hypothetical protein O0555_04680 [Brevibacillus laterosporus]|uniref:hypothetical protein n=1 Tax=Brevibacillus laterosporus TaxID=1465 RepID=UPI0018CF501C|nr:hypothetical protein [Brevibacillus laterosporus]MBG9775883.1 hypothetical protein [Brevibacillus laterosporus]MBG9796721.1 hypothetical protein [Brevibacillus laterosporus]MCR8936649.1 hypothetical protein [Brevibacillus laterosporus]MCZ0839288.1 hypothetical protein [Brevibacillus laterosporus]MCZ0844152.1 hypothetical protein [Brevibacillus laterosporus]